MDKLEKTGAPCINRIRQILAHARAKAMQSVNAATVSAYWQIGREIVEEEQRGAERAKYGARLLQEISARLTMEFGRGFSVTNIRDFCQFYLHYRDREPAIRFRVGKESPTQKADQIHHPPGGELGAATNEIVARTIRSPAGAESAQTWKKPLALQLFWSHCLEIMRVSNPKARDFYEIESARSQWSQRAN